MSEQDREDLSIYDLAARAAAGQPLTDAAHREIAAELLRVTLSDEDREMLFELSLTSDHKLSAAERALLARLSGLN